MESVGKGMESVGMAPASKDFILCDKVTVSIESQKIPTLAGGAAGLH